MLLDPNKKRPRNRYLVETLIRERRRAPGICMSKWTVIILGEPDVVFSNDLMVAERRTGERATVEEDS
ncbi:MAG: hypothetical protein GY820_37885 [Gammaproteobacteria bacterium]|nr:hypothetical protein [Gammaproteobacteria bacterium]